MSELLIGMVSGRTTDDQAATCAARVDGIRSSDGFHHVYYGGLRLALIAQPAVSELRAREFRMAAKRMAQLGFVATLATATMLFVAMLIQQ